MKMEEARKEELDKKIKDEEERAEAELLAKKQSEEEVRF